MKTFQQEVTNKIVIIERHDMSDKINYKDYESNFSPELIKFMMKDNKDEFGINMNEPYAKELAVLQLQDLKRKGCHVEYLKTDCRKCPYADDCPLLRWTRDNERFANDALAKEIYRLSHGTTDEQFRQKRDAKRVTDYDRASALNKIVDLYLSKSEFSQHADDFMATVVSLTGADTMKELESNVDKLFKEYQR